MAQNDNEKDPILKRIPKDQLSPEQKAFRETISDATFPWYEMTREPTHFDDVECYSDSYIDDRAEEGQYDVDFVIWRDNGTLICIGDKGRLLFKERHISFSIDEGDPCGKEYVIYGKNETAIAETATFFWSLKDDEDSEHRRKMSVRANADHGFTFATFQPEQLAVILDANPKRTFQFEVIAWSAEQSVILATRPYPLNVKLVWCSIKDDGTAFVNALEKRHQPSFGSFSMTFCSTYKVSFSIANWKRIFQLDLSFEKLEMSMLDEECMLLPFSVKTNSLKYEIDLTHLETDDFESLIIVAKDLDLNIFLSLTYDWDERLISIIDRLAALGHFERLCFSLHGGDYRCLTPKDTTIMEIAEALIEAMTDNPKLECLSLSSSCRCFHWFNHFQEIFEALEDHKGMRKLVIDKLVSPMDDVFDNDEYDSECSGNASAAYSWLEQLLSVNRNITVCNKSGQRFSDGPRVDNLYLLNDIFNRSADLVKESPFERSLIIATALVGSAATKFQHSALLLSKHTDMLCEMIHSVNLNERMMAVPEEAEISVPSDQVGFLKRKTENELTRDAKKAA